MIKADSFKRLLVWTLFLIVLLLIYVLRSNPVIAEPKLLLPELASQADSISHIKIEMANATWILEKKADKKWFIENKAALEVKLSWLRALISGLAEMTVLEPKTQNPNAYSTIHVDVPTLPDSEGIQVQGFAKAGDEPLFNIVLGKRQARPTNPEVELIFVRPVDDSQSYLVEGTLPESFDLSDILVSNVFGFQKEKIKHVSLKEIGGAFVLSRKNKKDSFSLESNAAANKIKSSFLLDDVVAALNALKVEDILPKIETLDWQKALQVTINTFEGHEYNLSFLTEKDRILLAMPHYAEWLFIINKEDFDRIAVKGSDLLELSTAPI